MKIYRATNRNLIEDFNDGSLLRHFGKKYETAFKYYKNNWAGYDQIWEADATNIATLTEEFCSNELLLPDVISSIMSSIHWVRDFGGRSMRYNSKIVNRFDDETIKEFPYVVASELYFLGRDINKIDREELISILMSIKNESIYRTLDVRTLIQDLKDLGYYGFTTNDGEEVWVFDQRALSNIQKIQ